jgi:GPH family glycoside/pentoside/hexuronide:cation symporter
VTAPLSNTVLEALAATVAEQRTKRLGAGFKSAYGLGQCVESIPTAVLSVFLFFYITTVCGLSGSLTGLALFFALAIDAVADPVVGSISDNLSTRWGRRIPPMAISLVPIAVASGILFSVPRQASGWLLFAYVLAMLTFLRVSMSGFVIPYLSLGAELSDDYDERSSIVGFRAIFAMLATLGTYVLGFGVFLSGPKGLLDRAAYAPFGWTCGAIVLVLGAFASYASLRALPRLHATPPSDRRIWRRLFGEVREVFRNPAFRLLFAGVLVFFVGQGVYATLGLHAGKYFWKLDVHALQLLAIAGVVGLALGLPAAFALIGHMEKRNIVLAGISTICLAEALPVLGQILGFLPTNTRGLMSVLLVAAVVIGAATVLVAIAFQSAMADAVDQHEVLFGARREGLYFASLSFASKAAVGLGSLISGLLLDAIAFPGAAIAAGRSVVVPPNVVRDLGLAYGPIAAFITIVSVAILWRYRLDRAAHDTIRRALGR